MKQVLLCVVLGASVAFGAAGDLVQSASFADQVWSDVAFDADGSAWALGEADGKIYRISASLQLLPAGTIDHPFGAQSSLPPFKPVCRGLACDTVASVLFVLNGSTFEVARVNPANGAKIGDFVTLQAPAGAGLESLSFDPSGNVLWSIDSEGDRVLGFDPGTGALLKELQFPGNVPPETYLFGKGVQYVSRAGSQYLYISWGDIFAGRADTVRILSAVDGAEVQFAIPLAAAGEGTIRGVAAANDRILVLLARTGSMALSSISAAWPSFLPVTQLACTPEENGVVQVSWRNNGTGEQGAYTSLVLLRNGNSIAQLAGNAVSYADLDAPAGDLTYTVRPQQGIVRGLDRSCSLRNRRGAVLEWIPFPGGVVSGIATDPDTGDVWVTDSKAVSTGVYRIWHFSADLQVVGYFDATLGGAPYGITFWPNYPYIDPPETLILIANEATNLVQKFHRDGTAAGGSVPMRLPPSDDPAAPSPKVGALAFDADNGAYPLVILDDALHQIVWVDRNGQPPTVDDTEHRRVCVPSGLYEAIPARGIDRCPQSDLLQFGVAGGAMREVDVFCNVTTFDLAPWIPVGFRTADRLKDFAYRLNSVYVSSPANNAIFRVLAYPTGRPFVRGNIDGDAENKISIFDVIYLLMYLFEKGAEVTCLDAADANDDGRIDISDAVYMLFFEWGGGPPPAAPYPTPGTDPTLADELSC